MVLANLYGAYRAYLWKPATGTSVQVGLVQPNIALAENNEYYAARYFETLPELYRRAVQDGADWVIFPEAQNPYFFGEDFYYTRFQQNLAARNPAYLLFNSTSVERDSRYFNSAYLLDPDGKPVYRYDKMHLVPFGEYIPFKEWLNFAQPLVREVGEFAAGADFKLGQVEGIRFATLICYEGIFPELAREYQRRGAELLVIVTNDAWYGPSGAPRQHLEMAAFRAVETRRTVLRCANSGYSAVIDPLGRFRRLSGLFREELLRTEATACTADTVYAHAGDWLNLALACATLAVSLVTARHSGQRAQRAKRPRKAQGRRQPRGKEG
jgi:apolipoprotein N-acyltransferase